MQIQGWSEVPWRYRLFDSLLVFQNYLVDEAAQRMGSLVEIQNFNAEVRTNYPLAIVVVPGAEILVRFVYQAHRFDSGAIARLLEALTGLLQRIASSSADRLSELMEPLSTLDAEPLPGLRRRPRPDSERNYVAPQTDAEKAIAGIWQELFQIDKVGIHDNFFDDLGGHSLIMAHVHRRLQKDLKTGLSIIKMFQYPTIHLLAKHLTEPSNERLSFQNVFDRAKRQRQQLARRRELVKN